ncbi:MAG: threonine/serine dehydratase [Gammaproteobacteria bacterium]|nr:MAG: threonine/serine dehydratase [Gammaproteobacteria bacterium]UTW42588.1 threonine/serine dehydratase [bacterium SCSIO 12844]
MANHYIDEVKSQYQNLASYVRKTPILPWQSKLKNSLLGEGTQIYFKCELFQQTGTFKFRGVLSRLLSLTGEEKKPGVIAGTGGNHGIALAYAASLLNIDSTIIIPRSINPLRLTRIKAYATEIIQVDNINEVLDTMHSLAEKKAKTIVHPFDHPLTTLGTATLGYEWLNQLPKLDVLLIATGGGGLLSGVAKFAKLFNPNIQVFGIEPELAPTMSLSFEKNKPIKLIDGAKSIADSLNAPNTLDYSFGICREYVDDIILVNDKAIKQAMKLLVEETNLVCEPAAAATTAALIGPLKNRLSGLKIGNLLCGSNIDINTFYQYCNEVESILP